MLAAGKYMAPGVGGIPRRKPRKVMRMGGGRALHNRVSTVSLNSKETKFVNAAILTAARTAFQRSFISIAALRTYVHALKGRGKWGTRAVYQLTKNFFKQLHKDLRNAGYSSRAKMKRDLPTLFSRLTSAHTRYKVPVYNTVIHPSGYLPASKSSGGSSYVPPATSGGSGVSGFGQGISLNAREEAAVKESLMRIRRYIRGARRIRSADKFLDFLAAKNYTWSKLPRRARYAFRKRLNVHKNDLGNKRPIRTRGGYRKRVAQAGRLFAAMMAFHAARKASGSRTLAAKLTPALRKLLNVVILETVRNKFGDTDGTVFPTEHSALKALRDSGFHWPKKKAGQKELLTSYKTEFKKALTAARAAGLSSRATPNMRKLASLIPAQVTDAFASKLYTAMVWSPVALKLALKTKPTKKPASAPPGGGQVPGASNPGGNMTVPTIKPEQRLYLSALHKHCAKLSGTQAMCAKVKPDAPTSSYKTNAPYVRAAMKYMGKHSWQSMSGTVRGNVFKIINAAFTKRNPPIGSKKWNDLPLAKRKALVAKGYSNARASLPAQYRPTQPTQPTTPTTPNKKGHSMSGFGLYLGLPVGYVQNRLGSTGTDFVTKGDFIGGGLEAGVYLTAGRFVSELGLRYLASQNRSDSSALGESVITGRLHLISIMLSAGANVYKGLTIMAGIGFDIGVHQQVDVLGLENATTVGLGGCGFIGYTGQANKWFGYQAGVQMCGGAYLNDPFGMQKPEPDNPTKNHAYKGSHFSATAVFKARFKLLSF